MALGEMLELRMSQAEAVRPDRGLVHTHRGRPCRHPHAPEQHCCYLYLQARRLRESQGVAGSPLEMAWV